MRPILPKLKLGVDASGLPYRVPEEARLTFYYWPQVTVGFGAIRCNWLSWSTCRIVLGITCSLARPSQLLTPSDVGLSKASCWPLALQDLSFIISRSASGPSTRPRWVLMLLPMPPPLLLLRWPCVCTYTRLPCRPGHYAGSHRSQSPAKAYTLDVRLTVERYV